MEKEFNSIKVGDFVSFYTGGWHGSTIIERVTKVTPKQFECYGSRFRKSDGAMIGNTFIKCDYATEGDIAQFKQAQRERRLKNNISDFFRHTNNIDKLSIDDLEAITNIIHKQSK